MAALERAQAVADLAAQAGLQFDRQGQVVEAQAVGDVIEQLNGQGVGKVMLDLQSHIAPTAQRQAAGHLSLQAGRGQAFEANGVDYRQDRQCQE
ncbi:hypothetical protein D3C84_755920 [compost metagenome]